MTREELFVAVGAAADTDLERSERKRKRAPWLAPAALTAAAALALAFLPKAGQGPDLPLLPNVGPGAGAAGGSYAVMAYDLAEVWPNSPGADTEGWETLPVWANPTRNGAGAPWGLAEEEMSERLERAAAALGVEILDVEEDRAADSGDPDVPQGALCFLRAKTSGNQTLTVYGNGAVEVVFGDPVALPEGYSFTYSHTGTAQAEKTLAYLTEEYAALLGFEEPRAVSPADYSFNGEQNRQYFVYDAAGDREKELVSYHFRRAWFSPDDEGRLWILRVYDGLCVGEKLGDYPIRSQAEARKALLKGDCQSAETEPFPGEEAIRGVELVYSSGVTDPNWMPYYRYWVEIPPLTEDLPQGLRTYASYYVPAVAPEYLTEVDTQMGQLS